MFRKLYLTAVVASVILYNTPLMVAHASIIGICKVDQVATPEEVEQYIRRIARELQIDEYTFVKVAKLESNLSVFEYNPKDTDGKPAIGLYQFKESTFDTYKHKYGVDFLDISNWKDQVRLASLMWKEGIEQYHWGTFVDVVKYRP